MKKLKTMMAAAASLVILLMAQGAAAQDKDAKAMLKESTPEQRAALQTGMMKNKLKLDSTQAAKVQVINLNYAQKLDPVLKSDGRKLKMLRDVMAIQKDKDAELKTALTADQYKQYEAMKDEMKDKLKEARQKN